MQTILSENLSALVVEHKPEPLVDKSPGARMVGAKAPLRVALKNLALVKPMSSGAKALMRHKLLEHDSEDVVGPVSEISHFSKRLKDLHALGVALHEALGQVLPEQHELSVAVRIPEPESLTDLAKTVEALDRIFARSVRMLVGEGVSVQNLDTGSSWIEIAVASVAALRVIGFVANLSLNVAERLLGLERTLESLRAIKIENEAMEAVVKNHKKTMDEFVDGQTELAVNTLGDPSAPLANKQEVLAQLRIAAIDFAAMIRRGATLQLPHKAPEELRSVMPKESLFKELSGAPPTALLGKGKPEQDEWKGEGD